MITICDGSSTSNPWKREELGVHLQIVAKEDPLKGEQFDKYADVQALRAILTDKPESGLLSSEHGTEDVFLLSQDSKQNDLQSPAIGKSFSNY